MHSRLESQPAGGRNYVRILLQPTILGCWCRSSMRGTLAGVGQFPLSWSGQLSLRIDLAFTAVLTAARTRNNAVTRSPLYSRASSRRIASAFSASLSGVVAIRVSALAKSLSVKSRWAVPLSVSVPGVQAEVQARLGLFVSGVFSAVTSATSLVRDQEGVGSNRITPTGDGSWSQVDGEPFSLTGPPFSESCH